MRLDEVEVSEVGKRLGERLGERPRLGERFLLDQCLDGSEVGERFGGVLVRHWADGLLRYWKV